MKKTYFLSLSLGLLGLAAAGQAAPKPTVTKRIVPNPAQDQYNKAISNYNRATQDLDSAHGSKDAALLAGAQEEATASIGELQAVAKLPAYQNDHNMQGTLHNLIGFLYLNQGNPSAAILELQAAVALQPNDLDARNNLGNALRQSQHYDEAAGQYRYILDHFQIGLAGLDAARVKFNLATTLGQAGKMDESLALFKDLAAANPDAATEKNYGFFLERSGRSDEAADAFRKSAELNPKDAAAWLSGGALYAKGRHYDDAIQTLTRAVGPGVDPKLDPAGSYMAYFVLGESHAAKGDLNQAAQDFDTASGFQPQNAVPVYNKGVVQEQAGLKADAEVSYRSALQKDPASIQIQTALGLLLADEGKAAEAIPFLAGAAPKLSQDAKASPVYARLGDQYAQQKEYALADVARRKALALNPNDADTRVALADSDMGRNQYAAALTEYNVAAKLRPNDPAIQNALGVAYKNLKQYPQALKAFQRSLVLDPRNAKVQNNIGVLDELLGNKASAVTAYKRALVLNPGLTVARKNLNRFAEK